MPPDHAALPAPQDRFTPFPAIAALCAAASTIFLCNLPGPLSVLLPILAILATLVVAIRIFLATCVLLSRWQWRTAMSHLLALVMPVPLLPAIVWLTACLHVFLTAGLGIGFIGPPPAAQNKAFAAWDWSTGLVGSGNTFLIYDITDAIARPLAPDQAASALAGLAPDCAGHVLHLLGHYYVCTF